MNINEYRQFLLANIKPWAKPASGGKVINCRCFYCRDSDDINHGHFYISMPSNKKPSQYYCHKCKVSGMVTPLRLMDWGVYDSNIAVELAAMNKNIINTSGGIYNNNSNVKYNIHHTRISINPETNKKIQYVSDRIGYPLTYQDCLDIKIVPNINDILSENQLKYTRDPRIITQLQSDFIGFLSCDNTSLNMRNVYMRPDIHSSLNKRYINYNLIDIENNITRRFYAIPNTIHLDSIEPIKLHIAEGPFDILSILFNLRRYNKQSIYASIGGSGYHALVEYFISTLCTPNIEIHLYPDNDVSRDTILIIFNKIRTFRYNFYIHRNLYPGEKDFGVPINRIQESIEMI